MSRSRSSRRAAHPLLHRSTWDRFCLYCFLQQHKKYLDFELHGFFHYPFMQRLRRDFLMLTKLNSMFANRSSVESFASLAACVCEDKDRGLRFSATCAPSPGISPELVPTALFRSHETRACYTCPATIVALFQSFRIHLGSVSLTTKMENGNVLQHLAAFVFV